MTTLFVIFLIIAAGTALVAQLVWWLSGRPDSERMPPPLVVPIHPRFARQLGTANAEAGVPLSSSEPLTVAAKPVAEPVAEPVEALVAAAAPSASAPGPVTAPVEASEAPAETVQFVRPTDDALQLLPARLEVVSGMNAQQVIRFVRIPGKPAEMILGRETASSPQQVTLTSSTVSRRHARVTYDNGRWLVTNLSRTNPVVVNDQALNEFEGARPLLDGDRIELGDVVLRFCTS